LSKKPSSGTAGGQKKATATREELLKDFRRIHKNFPNAVITRDFYRAHGKYTDQVVAVYGKLKDLVKEAGCAIEPPSVPALVVGVSQDAPIKDKLAFEREKLAHKKDDTKKLLNEALSKISALEQEKQVYFDVKEHTPQLYDIEPKVSHGTSESVAFMIGSDWHNEERVLPGDVNDLNEFNLEIFDKRADKFFQGGQRLWDIMRRDTDVHTLVLALLGDFITNSIHEDAAESNLLPPAEAVWNAQNKIINGIRFLLNNTEIKELIIPCHSGNHARTTQRQRHSTEFGNSLETLMYYNLREFFKDEPRIKFIIATGYHSYLNVFGTYLIRFHHGHNVRYAGGVGGLSIPVNKAINEWNKAGLYRGVMLDVFGHFHTHLIGTNFVANGSLIGYNSYAVSIKAPYEKPTQTFFLVNKKYNARTMTTPIFLE
jgi:hypothetical protein